MDYDFKGATAYFSERFVCEFDDEVTVALKIASMIENGEAVLVRARTDIEGCPKTLDRHPVDIKEL